MTTAPEPAPNPPRETSVFDTVANQYANVVGPVLFGLAAVLAVAVIVLATTRGLDALTLEIWLGGLAVAAVASGLAYYWAQQSEMGKALPPGDVLRLTALLAAGLAGLVTFIYGLLLIVLDYPSVFAGKIDVMRENLRTIVLCALPLFAGLALMYVGLALGQKFERTQAGLRRLLYGYNAVLGAALLFAILGVLNLLAYTHVPPFSALGRTLDWTGSGIYTLQEGSRKTVADLKQDVEVVILLRRSDPITPEVELLLENCRQVNPNMRWQIVSRDEDDRASKELLKKYPITGEGLLVLYGKPGEQIGEFIKREELLTATSRNPMDPEGGDAIFQGEFALIKTLSYLEEGRTHTTIYFTQGNGELDFNDASSTGRDQGLGALADQLGKGNYDLLSGPADKLPEKAEIVVIAGARKTFTPESVEALRKFLKPAGGKKPGKLLVLFDIAIADDKMLKTGLEELMADYNVTVGDSQILCLATQNPREVVVGPHLGGPNPIPKPYYTGEQVVGFVLYNVRSIQPAPPNPTRAFTTEILFEADSTYRIWAENNFGTDYNPDKLANELRSPANREKRAQKLSRVPIPVGVAVSADSSGLPPGHPGTGSSQKPVLIAFGDATWVSNREIQSRQSFDLFTACLSWLRERPEIGKMPSPPKRPTYEFNVTDEQQRRMYWLPGFLVLLTIVSLSIGVWLVRRR